MDGGPELTLVLPVSWGLPGVAFARPTQPERQADPMSTIEKAANQQTLFRRCLEREFTCEEHRLREK